MLWVITQSFLHLIASKIRFSYYALVSKIATPAQPDTHRQDIQFQDLQTTI
jgi:hypothetical protein